MSTSCVDYVPPAYLIPGRNIAAVNGVTMVLCLKGALHPASSRRRSDIFRWVVVCSSHPFLRTGCFSCPSLVVTQFRDDQCRLLSPPSPIRYALSIASREGRSIFYSLVDSRRVEFHVHTRQALHARRYPHDRFRFIYRTPWQVSKQ